MLIETSKSCSHPAPI